MDGSDFKTDNEYGNKFTGVKHNSKDKNNQRKVMKQDQEREEEKNERLFEKICSRGTN